MKKFFALAIVFSLGLCSGDLWAQERKKFEFSLSAVGGFSPGEGLSIIQGGVVSLGFYPTSVVGIELGGIIFVYDDYGGAIITGNVIVSPFNLKGVIPYATGGLWTTTAGGIGWNIGGGLKMTVSETMAIRAEYRRFGAFEEFDWGVNIISIGLSIFF